MVYSMVITAVNTSYLILMALHLVGVLFNIRMLASCFKDKASHTILHKSWQLMVWQCILQLTLLVLNADEVARAFSEQEQEWCRTKRILVTSVGLFMVYNLLALLAVEDPTIVCVKRELSPKAAMKGTLTAGVITCGILFWVGAVSSSAPCVSHIASTFASALMILFLLMLVFRICTQADHSMKSSTAETSLLLSFTRKCKTAVFLTAFVALVCTALAIVQLLSTAVSCFAVHVVTGSFYTQGNYAEFWPGVGFLHKICYLNIIWLAVGIALPVTFRQLIDSSVDIKEISDNNHFDSTKIAMLV